MGPAPTLVAPLAARASSRPRARVLAALVAALALLAALVTPTQPAATASQDTGGQWLVPAERGVPADARLLARLPVAGALIVAAPSAPPFGVSVDTPLTWHALAGEAAPDGTRLDSAVASTRADQVWRTTSGERTVVALIDTGVAPVPALEGAVAGEIDFTGTGGGDPYGHGTFMASLIAGRGPLAPGAAPGAGILSLKVARPDGSTDLGTVLGALQWLHGPGRALGIKVAVLALGVEPDSAAAELLDLATQRVSEAGVLVVTAAGNGGPGGLTSPATSPGTFSTGTVDDQATADRADDVLAAFSGTGDDRRGVAQPDVVASGVRVVGWMHPDSRIAQEHPDAFTPEGLFRGSGTSMSTAMVAGVAALTASAHPRLSGAALAQALTAADGELDAPTTLAAAGELGSQPPPPDRGRGRGRPAMRPPRRGEPAPAAIHWNAVHWNGRAWAGARWAAMHWNAIHWNDRAWGALHWNGRDWNAVHWNAVHWNAMHWNAMHWNGGRWGAIHWNRADWEAVHWNSQRWSAVHWNAEDWAAAHWNAVHWNLIPGG